MKFKAVIFDCDGVLADSEELSCSAWNVMLIRKYGFDPGRDYSQILGLNSIDTSRIYAEKLGLNPTKELLLELAREKDKTYLEIAAGKLKAVPGVERVIKQAKALGLKLAVASSGTHEKIRFNLKEIGLIDEFPIIVSSTEVKNGKPHPDVFLATAKKLGVDPRECIIIEDSITGVKAAKASKAFVIGITTSFSRQELLPYCDLVIDSFDELDLEALVTRGF